MGRSMALIADDRAQLRPGAVTVVDVAGVGLRGRSIARVGECGDEGDGRALGGRSGVES